MVKWGGDSPFYALQSGANANPFSLASFLYVMLMSCLKTEFWLSVCFCWDREQFAFSCKCDFLVHSSANHWHAESPEWLAGLLLLIQSLCCGNTFDFVFGNCRGPFTSPFTFSTGCCFISSGVQCPWYIHGSFCQVQMPSPHCKYGLSKSCSVSMATVDSSVHAYTFISLISLHV